MQLEFPWQHQTLRAQSERTLFPHQTPRAQSERTLFPGANAVDVDFSRTSSSGVPGGGDPVPWQSLWVLRVIAWLVLLSPCPAVCVSRRSLGSQGETWFLLSCLGLRFPTSWLWAVTELWAILSPSSFLVGTPLGLDVVIPLATDAVTPFWISS